MLLVLSVRSNAAELVRVQSFGLSALESVKYNGFVIILSDI